MHTIRPNTIVHTTVLTFVAPGNVSGEDLVAPTSRSEHSLHQSPPGGLAALQPLHQTHCQTDVSGAGIALDLVLSTDTQLEGEGVPARGQLVEHPVQEGQLVHT
jgi:hypothetical protein